MKAGSFFYKRFNRRHFKWALPPLALAVVLVAAFPGSGNGLRAQEAGNFFLLDATIAEIMESIVMPAADVLWNSVVIYSTQDGLVEEKPETDEDWQKLRWSAVNLAEATNLLVMPGRMVDNPGAVSEAPEYELGPEQIQALIDADRPSWIAHATSLHGIALQTINIIDAKNSDGLSEIGGSIDEACESCHLEFWYPEQ